MASCIICDQRLGASTKNEAIVVVAMTTVATGSRRWKTCNQYLKRLRGLPSLILRMNERESRKAEMKRKTSTPPETLPNQTWYSTTSSTAKARRP